MKLKDLQAKGGFVSAAPVKRSVTWTRAVDLDGKEESDTFDIWVKRLSFGMIEQMQAGLGDVTKERRSWHASLIEASVLLGEKHEEKLTFEQAYQLEPSLARVFVKEVALVNRLIVPDDTEGADAKN